MRGTLTSEWCKTWSVRSPWMCLVGTALLTVVTALSLANDVVHGISVGDLDAHPIPADQAVGPAVLFGLVAFVPFAMLPVTAEFATGSIRSTLLAQPRRRLVLAVKTVVVAGSGLALGLATGAASVAGTEAVLGEHAVPLDSPGLVVLKVGAVLGVDAVLVAGLAAALRSPVGTMATGVAVVAGMLALPDRVNAWTSGGAALRLLTGDAGDYPGPHGGLVAVAVLVAWAAATYAIGSWLFERRDA